MIGPGRSFRRRWGEAPGPPSPREDDGGRTSGSCRFRRRRLRPVGRPTGDQKAMPRRRGEPLQPAAVRPDRPEIVVAAAVRVESDSLAVRRPGRPPVARRIVGDLAIAGSIDSDDAQVLPQPSRREGDRLSFPERGAGRRCFWSPRGRRVGVPSSEPLSGSNPTRWRLDRGSRVAGGQVRRAVPGQADVAAPEGRGRERLGIPDGPAGGLVDGEAQRFMAPPRPLENRGTGRPVTRRDSSPQTGSLVTSTGFPLPSAAIVQRSRCPPWSRTPQ